MTRSERERERERERDRDRETERQRERQRQRQTETDRDRQRQRDRDRDRQTDRQGDREFYDFKYSGGKQASSTDTAISDKSILLSSQIRFLCLDT